MSAMAARHPCATSSTMLSTRKRRPQAELVMHEVQRPAGIGPCLDQDRRSCSHRPSSCTALAHREPFLAIQPIDTVDAGPLALPPEQDEQRPIVETPALIGKIAQPAAPLRLRSTPGSIADHLAITAPTTEQARRSDRPITACRCATAPRLATGPTIFLKVAGHPQLPRRHGELMQV